MTGHEDDHDDPIGTGGVLQNWSDRSGGKQGADIGSIGEIEPPDASGHESADAPSSEEIEEEEDPIETGGQLEQWDPGEAPIDTEPMPEAREPWKRGNEA